MQKKGTQRELSINMVILIGIYSEITKLRSSSVLPSYRKQVWDYLLFTLHNFGTTDEVSFLEVNFCYLTSSIKKVNESPHFEIRRTPIHLLGDKLDVITLQEVRGKVRYDTTANISLS